MDKNKSSPHKKNESELIGKIKDYLAPRKDFKQFLLS